VLRNEATQLDFEVERAKIELQTVRYEVHNDNGLKLGYIRLSQFDANSAVKMQQAIQALEKDRVSAYILDLRGNPGGLLYSSAEIARMFLNSGGIVSTVNREGVQDRIDANGHALTEKPLAVLVDGGSASASEILSGALKDNQRATLVGTQTFGKGLVQSVHELSGGAGLAVTIARYLTPNGTDINHKGIAPDVVVELSEQDLERLAGDREALATLGDPQYAAAVKSLGTELAQEAMPGPTAQTAAAN
jgi:carboxyl-terminal processing protease